MTGVQTCALPIYSEDCIKSFIEADENQEGKLIRLENQNGEIVVIPFDSRERLEFAINEDIDVR